MLPYAMLLRACVYIQFCLCHKSLPIASNLSAPKAQNFRKGARVRCKNGDGISSLSGSHTGGSPFSAAFSAIRAAKARPFGSGLLVPSETSTGLPPARACASSTNVRPRGAKFVGPPLFVFAMLFFTANLLRSSLPDPFFFKLLFRVGDRGAFS